jgi:transposase
MPWKNVTQMEEISRFVMLARSGRFTITDLCEQFGISRKTGHKHLERYAAEGLKGLQPRSHRPHHFPQRTDEAVETLILAERRLHRTWGPKKLHKVLQVKHGIETPPARSTIPMPSHHVPAVVQVTPRVELGGDRHVLERARCRGA